MEDSTALTNLALSKRKLIATVGLLMLVAGMMALITGAQTDPLMVRVEHVIDGDTIRVRYDGATHTVRLIGVDTPETKPPTKTVQRFGAEPSAYTKAPLEGQAVELRIDRIGDSRDRYGRMLRYVYLNGQNFNARLIREGYAHAIRRFRYTKKQHNTSPSKIGTGARTRLVESPLTTSLWDGLWGGFPRNVTCVIGPATFPTKPLRSIDRALPGEAQRRHAFGRCANSLPRRPGEQV